MEKISRQDAKRFGLKRYFTGEPCLHGHIAERLLSNNSCLECAKARLVKWRADNADHLKVYNKQNHDKWLAQPGNAELHREAAKTWYYANLERAKAAHVIYEQTHRKEINASKRKRRLDPNIRAQHNAETKAWREANADLYRETKRRHYEANTERWRAYCRNYRAAKLGNGGTHTPADIEALFDAQQGICVCGIALIKRGKGKFHVDHMMPISRGGSNGPENLQLLCQPCNNSKGARTMDEWLNT